MTDPNAPFERPPRKNPVVRTRRPVPPPSGRSRIALGLTAAAAEGRLALQVCAACGAVQHPAREVCGACLSDRLDWRDQDGLGTLEAATLVRHSYEIHFRERDPRPVGLVRLDAGVTAVAFLHRACPPPPARVRLVARLDRAGQAVLVALPLEEVPNMADDSVMRETACDPRHRHVLVTDGKGAVGQATAEALLAAGAALVWLGHGEPWRRSPGFEALCKHERVVPVPLDLTDSRSVVTLAGEIGHKVDILVNTAEVHRTLAPGARHGIEIARAEMDVNYFGLVRLAEAFAPAMAARGADGVLGAVAWVNLLSVYALSGFAPHSTFSASKAAALNYAQSLRASLLASAIRVVNVFPGPVDEDWNQATQPPKLAPAALGQAIVRALQDGLEDVYPDPVARDWLARWRENPKALEREIMP